jgi:predicted nucleotide-binding protein (sugar kinase/HSP70/actin superfamily)
VAGSESSLDERKKNGKKDIQKNTPQKNTAQKKTPRILEKSRKSWKVEIILHPYPYPYYSAIHNHGRHKQKNEVSMAARQ